VNPAHQRVDWGEGSHTYSKENIISSKLNEDRDIGTNGGRGLRAETKRRAEKDESRKGRLGIGQLLAPSLTLALTRLQLGQRGSGGGAITCFVLITPADKPDELIGCFLLLIGREKERERETALFRCGCGRAWLQLGQTQKMERAPEGRRVLMSSAARLIIAQILLCYLPMIRRCLLGGRPAGTS
jgi:hypothetical protein